MTMKCRAAALLLVFITAACGGITSDEPADLYLPPTRAGDAVPLIIQPTATPTADISFISTQAAIPTPTPACLDGLRYIEDVSIPDGMQVSAGERLDKRWRVENNGTCNWDAGYRIRLVSGQELGAASEQALYPARSGTQIEIRMVFMAPNEPGLYRGAWQAYSPSGQLFGEMIFIEIRVGG
jgi:hypothetical protein